MRLFSVEIENWRKLPEKRIEFENRTTVIHGPNETGKSTILEALSRGFFDRSSSRAEEIRRIRPLTALGSVSSIVKINFSLNDEKYRVEKTFNHNRGTFLYRIEDSKETLLAQDDDADRKLIEMLEADLQISGASKPSKWGAFYWLWTPQDSRELPTEGEPTRSLHLDQSGGTVLVTPKFNSVQSRIINQYSQYFTETGRPIKNSPIPRIEDDIAGLKITARERKSRIQIVEDHKRELEDTLRELPRHVEILNNSKLDIEKAREDARDFSKIKAELDVIEARIREIERNIGDASRAIQELQDSSGRIRELQNEEKIIRENLSRVEAICVQLESQLKKLNKETGDKLNELKSCDELLADARILYSKNSVLQQIKELERKTVRITKINEKLEELRSREKPLLITQKELEELYRSQIQIKGLNERLSESGLYVNIAPGEKDALTVEVDGKEIEENQQTATGTQEVKVSYESLGEVNIRANLQKARDIKSDIERLQSNISNVLNKNSAKSIDELKELHAEQTEILNEVKQYLAERKGVDERPLEEIGIMFEALREKHHKYETIERSELAIKSNPTDIDLGELIRKRESERKKSDDELNELRGEREEISIGLETRKNEMTELRTRNEHLSDDLRKSVEHERGLIRKYGSQENQEKILEGEKEKLSTQVEEHKVIKKRHKEIEEGPISRIKNLESKIENQEQIIQQHRASIEQLRGKIIEGSLDGSYSQLSEAESMIEALEERLQREELQAKSIKLLKDILEQQYQKALRSVTEPIKQDVESYLSYVTGKLHDEVELNDNLIPIRLGERGLEELSLTFEDGSSGLKEVLALCVRLAVAKHLSERDTQCLVLDDPFVHVSSDRSEKMTELINKVIDDEGLQVVVLTHRPMEFAGFTGKIIDIQTPRR